jgi:hypothetical protein
MAREKKRPAPVYAPPLFARGPTDEEVTRAIRTLWADSDGRWLIESAYEKEPSRTATALSCHGLHDIASVLALTAEGRLKALGDPYGDCTV